MGRTDAWALNLPEPPPVMPEAGSASQTAGAQLLEMLGGRGAAKQQPARDAVPAESREPAEEPPAARPARTSCPSCKASMSAVEQKLERCLTCGASFTAGSCTVSVGI